jgi:hypothetical protein
MTRHGLTPTQLDDAIEALHRERAGRLRAEPDELVVTARLVRDVLPRSHPRFGFEEHLARRLSTLSRPPRSGSHAAGEPTPIRPGLAAGRPDPAAGTAALTAADRRRRGLVAGGAIASGVSLAIPIAGAAIVAWRRSRSSGGLP